MQAVRWRLPTLLKSDDVGWAAHNGDPLRSATAMKQDDIGQHRDGAWWTCVRTCKDPATGAPTPELCSPLNPQPNHTWEVVAPQVGGNLDNHMYGANGMEWRQWMQPNISGGKVTAMPAFNARDVGFSTGSSAGKTVQRLFTAR